MSLSLFGMTKKKKDNLDTLKSAGDGRREEVGGGREDYEKCTPLEHSKEASLCWLCDLISLCSSHYSRPVSPIKNSSSEWVVSYTIYRGAVHVLLTELRIYSRRVTVKCWKKLCDWLKCFFCSRTFKCIQRVYSCRRTSATVLQAEDFCINVWPIYPAPCNVEIILIQSSIEYSNEK